MKGRERMRLKTAAERRSGTCVVADCEAKQDSFGFCVEHRKTLAAALAEGVQELRKMTCKSEGRLQSPATAYDGDDQGHGVVMASSPVVMSPVCLDPSCAHRGYRTCPHAMHHFPPT